MSDFVIDAIDNVLKHPRNLVKIFCRDRAEVNELEMEIVNWMTATAEWDLLVIYQMIAGIYFLRLHFLLFPLLDGGVEKCVKSMCLVIGMQQMIEMWPSWTG